MFADIANKPQGFDLTTLEALIDDAATKGGNFTPLVFKCTLPKLADYVRQAFGPDVRISVGNNAVQLIRNDRQCDISRNGYVSGWKG